MAAVVSAPGIPRSRFNLDSDSLSTIRDPRSPSDGFPSPQGSVTSSPHPDLNIEIATLSNKLISAINHQTQLDDALAAARQELEETQARLKKAETVNYEHNRLLNTGELVKKDDTERQKTEHATQLAEEKEKRIAVEREKKKIEQELENLTTALFEEANQMVAAARKEHEASERRNDQLRAQLKESESLLSSQQEQLAELKEVMSQMNQPRDDLDKATAHSTAPSTPALPSQNEIDRTLEAIHIASTDLVSYEDFKALLDISRKSTPSSRVNSGSYGGVPISGFGASGSISAAAIQHATQMPFQSTGTQQSTGPSPASPQGSMAMYIPLRETRFYKRALTEDIEPTLRLDSAPGLSWLARRSVLTSICDGTLVVEPMPSSTRMSIFSCALCGESRKTGEFTRTHRFRTSESDSAQRYPLCGYCLGRLRATCDFLGFLRMVKDGHWRTHNQQTEKAAWEESVRLRERMFWARMGGGVIPSFLNRDSPRISSDEPVPATPMSAPPAILSHGESGPPEKLDDETTQGAE